MMYVTESLATKKRVGGGGGGKKKKIVDTRKDVKRGKDDWNAP